MCKVVTNKSDLPFYLLHFLGGGGSGKSEILKEIQVFPGVERGISGRG